MMAVPIQYHIYYSDQLQGHCSKDKVLCEGCTQEIIESKLFYLMVYTQFKEGHETALCFECKKSFRTTSHYAEYPVILLDQLPSDAVPSLNLRPETNKGNMGGLNVFEAIDQPSTSTNNRAKVSYDPDQSKQLDFDPDKPKQIEKRIHYLDKVCTTKEGINLLDELAKLPPTIKGEDKKKITDNS